jgi:hypothetical protein
LGTFITEWEKGAEICREMFATEDSAHMYAERLAELAAALGFDGWLVVLHLLILHSEVIQCLVRKKKANALFLNA